jgi:hypothetical protein
LLPDELVWARESTTQRNLYYPVNVFQESPLCPGLLGPTISPKDGQRNGLGRHKTEHTH